MKKYRTAKDAILEVIKKNPGINQKDLRIKANALYTTSPDSVCRVCVQLIKAGIIYRTGRTSGNSCIWRVAMIGVDMPNIEEPLTMREAIRKYVERGVPKSMREVYEDIAKNAPDLNFHPDSVPPEIRAMILDSQAIRLQRDSMTEPKYIIRAMASGEFSRMFDQLLRQARV